MPKPPGIGLSVREGAVTLSISKTSRAEDAIYDAVEEAQNEGMSPTRFVEIARSAWGTTREEQAAAEDREFQKLKL